MTVPQKVEVAKAALFSDYVTILKVDIASKPLEEYQLISPISLMSVQQPN